MASGSDVNKRQKVVDLAAARVVRGDGDVDARLLMDRGRTAGPSVSTPSLASGRLGANRRRSFISQAAGVFLISAVAWLRLGRRCSEAPGTRSAQAADHQGPWKNW